MVTGSHLPAISRRVGPAPWAPGCFDRCFASLEIRRTFLSSRMSLATSARSHSRKVTILVGGGLRTEDPIAFGEALLLVE